MSRFLLLLDSGPCMGSYEVARAPAALRAVRGRGGALDVLDQVDDTPREDESVFVYQRLDGVGHLCGRGRGGCQQTVTYRYVGQFDKKTGEVRTLTARDYEWWQEQRMAALSAWAMGVKYKLRDPPPPAPEPLQGTLL